MDASEFTESKQQASPQNSAQQRCFWKKIGKLTQKNFAVEFTSNEIACFLNKLPLTILTLHFEK